MSEKFYNQLEELPDKWAQLKKKVMLMKQSVVPLQQKQAAKIKRKLISFDVKQHNYREAFRKSKAFFYDCEKPYTIINTALAKEMSVTTIIVDACTIPGLVDKLESIQSELVKCEKALAEYLETKRLAFPRFYFVSSADLLDILSNGNNPPVVSKQLTKLFDSLADLQFTRNNYFEATGMISKEGESVKLDGKCDLSGQVEAWLCRVEESMKSTIRHVMGEAVTAYEEKPREKWVFDYPAQPALCGTQIWWTLEVNQAFLKLEEGHESALKDYLKKQVGHFP
ncbi:dynein heavy chain 17, axonemal [Plakobranchus ocellatus]|uniref:Dynein heavy chain 17, axonemal n=1 Tax=Plakobranchus ocellatus TaxID=259542 RepID=A0AAV3YAC0_9GAST|nr:dynein heavy chain 17, axonemal [Plakobranchus ocellatus]